MSAKVLDGVVVSTKMQKTVVVKVSLSKKHAQYGKRYISHKNYKVDYNEVDYSGDSLKEGDKVSIVEVAPVSKTKTWKIKEDKK
jgi:small subunit ribosomal protein S17